MYDIIIRDATIISSTGRLVADIAIEDGRIADVGGPVRGAGRKEIQGIGLFVMPGVIDSQVRMGVPGDGMGYDWARQSRAALAAGVTAVVDTAPAGTGFSSADAVRAVLDDARAASVVDYGLWMPAGHGNLDLVRAVISDGLALAPYLRMDLEDGDLEGSLDALEALLKAGLGTVGVHAEDPDVLARAARKHGGPDAAPHDLRPASAAAQATEQLIQAARDAGGAAHLCSLSTAAELNLLDAVHGEVSLSSSVSPQHLFLSIETWKKGHPVVTDPPVRGELDRRGLWAAIRRGRVDCFHSAHTPVTSAVAHGPRAGRAVGVPAVDLLLPLLMSAVKHGRLNMERLVAMCCEGPAALFGLENKGRIEVGYDADLVFLREGESLRLRNAPEPVGAGWTPFLNREVGLLPQIVIAGGKIVARSGLLSDELQPGKALVAHRG